MPRKRGHDADDHAKNTKGARWRYLLRNPGFQADLAVLRRACTGPVEFEFAGVVATVGLQFIREELMKKWDLNFIPSQLYYFHSNMLPALSPETVPEYEAFFATDAGELLIGEAVWDGTEWYEEDPKKVLILGLNLSYPADVLVALAEARIRAAKAARGQSLPHRRRLDKLDSQLAVFDRAQQGQKFRDIAKALGRRLSTVKSAYLAASRNIFGSGRARPKKRLPLEGFDAEDHAQKCPQCRQAQAFEEMCTKAKLYAGQDVRGRDELPGLDVNRNVRKHSATAPPIPQPDQAFRA